MVHTEGQTMIAKNTGRRLLLGCLLAAVLLLATGCSPATQVVGTWDLDYNKALPSEFQSLNPAIAAQLLFLKPPFQVKFAGDGNFSLKAAIGPQNVEKKGSWRFVKAEGKTVLLMIIVSGQNEESELRFTVVDNEHAEIAIPLPFGKGPMPFHFVKAKPAS
jgi:hypothetical protein